MCSGGYERAFSSRVLDDRDRQSCAFHRIGPRPHLVKKAQESGLGGLTYRYTYGLEKINAVMTGIANGAGSVMQYVYDDGVGGFVLTDENPAATCSGAAS